MARIALILVISILGIAAGCAGTKQTHKDKNTLIAEMKAHNADPKNADNKYVCREEKPTGSNIPIVVCRTQMDIRNRTLNDQIELGRLLRRTKGN